VLVEDPERLAQVGVGIHGDEVGRHDHVDPGVGAEPVGQGAGDQVAVGHDPDRVPVGLDHHQRAHGQQVHERGGLGDRPLSRDAGGSLARCLYRVHDDVPPVRGATPGS
jgi:hypothetical protein